jgi:hypothetical protein
MKKIIIFTIMIFSVCSFVSCKTTKAFYCGDGNCNAGETCSSCPADCGPCAPPPIPPPPTYNIALAWDPNPPEDEVEGYRIHMGLVSGQYRDVWSTPETSLVIGGLQPGIAYYFAAKAYRGGLESGFSNELCSGC